MDPDEARAVLDVARGDRLDALAVLVLAVGVRQGKTFNLRWDDVDLDAGTLTIREAKTDAARRTVAFPKIRRSSAPHPSDPTTGRAPRRTRVGGPGFGVRLNNRNPPRPPQRVCAGGTT
ncbi:MAG: tyrosine-type recombinase/integrase [Actinomycetota bacterium]|nr:tyrosine-type recombinase/integrase [Actinomycetota bacterium]